MAEFSFGVVDELALSYLDDRAVLEALVEANEERTAATLNVRFLSPGSVARALGRLRTPGYVNATNRTVPGRRRLLYEATDKGRAVLEAIPRASG